MLMFRKLAHDSTGDTIVEVLIAIAVIGIVLGGAFVSVNRSLKGTQLSKERVEALGLTRSQMEILMERLSDPDAGSTQLLADTKEGCYLVGSDPLYTISLETSDLAKCKSGLYTSTIARADHVYTVKTTWDDGYGDSDGNHITMNYNASRP